MLETVDVGTQDLNLYEQSARAEAVAQLRELASPLEGARILHINATPYGAGRGRRLQRRTQGVTRIWPSPLERRTVRGRGRNATN
jgi:hypothetical protein